MIFLVKNCGYYSNLENAIFIGKNNRKDIYQIIIDNNLSLDENENDNDSKYNKIYLKIIQYCDFYYYIYAENENFYDENDKITLEKLKQKQRELDKIEFENKKNIIYEKPILLGWVDYPKQFFEKNPSFNGIVRFQKLLRKDFPNYILKNYQDCSSKHVDEYYYAEYIGNYEIFFKKEFFMYDGETINEDGRLFPNIEEIWKFETDRYPFQDWLFDIHLKLKKEKDIIIENFEEDNEYY
jgi:hypothetical protein